MAIETDTIDAPASWASYLVNGDATGFDYYGESGALDMAACDEWVATLAHKGWRVVSCEGEPFYWRGSELITYTILRTR